MRPNSKSRAFVPAATDVGEGDNEAAIDKGQSSDFELGFEDNQYEL